MSVHQIIVMESARNEEIIYAMGYKYKLSKVLSFIPTPVAGASLSINPYKAWCYDHHGNFHAHFFLRPHTISSLFDHINYIGMQNHSRQCGLAIEKAWMANLVLQLHDLELWSQMQRRCISFTFTISIGTIP